MLARCIVASLLTALAGCGLTDRLGSETGLRGQLNLAVAHMEEFVLAAEHTAGTYLQVDADNATKNRYY